MGRLVAAQSAGPNARIAPAPQTTSSVNDYLERVAKYVPAEIIAVYTAVNGYLVSLPDTLKQWSMGISLVIFWIFTPIYFNLIATPSDKPALKTQQWVSFIGFIVWAYNFSGDGGLFGKTGLNIYYQALGAAIMALFSFISGAIIPKGS